MVSHSSESFSSGWKADGDFNAAIIRILDTGTANVNYLLSNPLGREPVGVMIQKKNKACDVYVSASTRQNITVKFTVANCDVVLMVW